MTTMKNNSRPARSLTYTFAFAFVALSALILLVNSGLILYTDIGRQRQAIADQQQLIAQNSSQAISSFIEDKYKSLESATKIIELPAGTPEQRKLIFQGLLATEASFRQLILLNESGESAAEVSRVSLELSDQFLSQLRQTISNPIGPGKHYISPLYFDNVTHEPLIILAIPVDIWNFKGTLAAEVNLQFMWTLVDQLKVGQTGYVYVVDKTGNLIAAKDTARVLAGENVSRLQKVKEYIAGPTNNSTSSNYETYLGLSGVRVVGAYIPLNAPEWAVVIELPWTEAYRDIILLIERALATILGVAVMASLIGVVLARRLAAPIIELSTAAGKIAKGNLNVRASVVGPNEIVHLSDSFNEMISQLHDLVGNLEKRVAQRTTEIEIANKQTSHRATQLHAITTLSEEIAQVRDLNELFNIITHLISELFGFYHVGIFIVDSEKEYAVLQAANSEGGERMLARAHRLKLGSGVVGYSAQTGLSRIALDVGNDAVYFNNPDLPATRSEAALPLKARGETIGVLDVQSTEAGAFSVEDLQVLNALANQVSIALENIRLLTETRAALKQAEEVYNEFTRTEWDRVINQSDQTGFRYQDGRIEMVEDSLETPEAILARSTGSVAMKHVKGANGRRPTVAVPVRLRGEVIGILQIEADDLSREWQQEDVSLVQSVAERAAFALENARLFQDARRRASKEQLISESTTRISSALNIENILRTTAQELERVLGGSEVMIRFRRDKEA